MSSSSSTSTHFFVGLDLGQSSDYAAISILQKSEKPESGSIYRVRHLERPALNTPYPQIVNRVAFIMNSIELADRGTLVVDQTGIGAPVFDMFVKAGLDPVGIYIHGGDSTSSQDGRTWRVPKRDLVGVLQVLLQSGRLKIATKLELGSILEAEMLNFKVKIDPATAHDSYSAWRENQHDDLVLSVALAAWYGVVKGAKITLDFTKIEVPPGRWHDEIEDRDGFRLGIRYY